MDNWLKVSILLCIFGFLRELRPHEPFAVEYFVTYRNVSMETLTNHFFPIGTYMSMSQLIVIFLITDLLKSVKLQSLFQITIYKQIKFHFYFYSRYQGINQLLYYLQYVGCCFVV